MGREKKRKTRRDKERESNLDILAALVAKNFTIQCMAATAEELLLITARAEKSVDALFDEINWDELEGEQKKSLEQFVAQIRSERETNPGFLTLTANISAPGMSADDYLQLGARVRERLVPSGLQSMEVFEREPGTIWFIGIFAH